MINETISHYTVLEKLGEGGMGVVYRARDTKLERDVALKFLPDRTIASEADKARFIQEAKAASALNHPNVCTIHDIAEHDGRMFIVMEYIDGRTLRERMPSMTHRQAVEIGTQVADGLAAAHEKGIVHRDIKPENIMVRKDGIVQIMDFGLAKLRASSSKITRLTKAGSTVGTAGYMSPEQVQGHDADHRSDIFSLGVLLYELFAGRLPFNGVHETALAYEIVNVDPAPMSVVRPDLDPVLDAIVLECMEKDPNERTQSAKQVSVDLRRYKRESSRQRASRITAARPVAPGPGGYTGGSGVAPVAGSAVAGTDAAGRGSVSSGAGFAVSSGIAGGEFAAAPAVPAQPAPGAAGPKLPWIAAAFFLLTTAGTVAWHFADRSVPSPKPVTRSSILPPPRGNFNVSVGGHIAISPDGKLVAFVASDSSTPSSLWIRPVASMTAIRMPGTQGAQYPFWSHDGRTVAFFADSKMKKVEASGGPVLTICDAPDGRGGTWNAGGTIVFSPESNGHLWKVSSAGGTPVQLTFADTAGPQMNHRWPHFLPDGDHFIYTTQSTVGGTVEDSVRIGALDGTGDRVLMIGNTNVEYASGYILFHRQSTLMAQPFDAAGLATAGDAVPIAENLQFGSFRNKAIFSVSRSGVLIYQGGAETNGRLALLDEEGDLVRIIGTRNAAGGRLSNDGMKVAIGVRDDQARSADVWIHDIASGRDSRFTFDQAIDRNPFWSPDDRTIVFSSIRGRNLDLYTKDANGTDAERLLLATDQDKLVSDWSRDGSTIAFTTTGNQKTRSDLWLLPMRGDGKPVPFLQTEFRESGGTFSPDGRWLAYSSDETGRFEIYVRALDGSPGKFQVSIEGGGFPVWSSDGRRIFFQSTDRKAMSASVRITGATVIVDSIRVMFDLDARGVIGGLSGISRDGERFLGLIGESRSTIPPITMVVNWEEELKKK